MYKDISITWTGDITSIAGSAQHARQLLKPLIEGGAHIKLEPRKPGVPEIKLSEWWIDNIQRLIESPPGMVCINHGHPMQMRKNEVGGPTVLFTHWDTYNLPGEWVNRINEYDQVWTPTRSLASNLKIITKKTSYILPYYLEDKDFDYTTPAEIDGIDKSTFVFGATGHWNNRRNMTDVITAYIGAFSDKDNVALLIKTISNDSYNPNSRIDLINVINTIKGGFNKKDIPKIIVIQDPVDDKAMDEIINRFNCFVSASRGDSKNISMLKAMAKGKPCIFPLVHANADIINSMNIDKFKNYIYPISHSAIPVMQMGTYYTAYDFWANINVEELMVSMKKVFFDTLDPSYGISKHLIAAVKKSYTSYALPDLIKNVQPSAIKSLI